MNGVATHTVEPMPVPEPRGPLSAAVIDVLRTERSPAELHPQSADDRYRDDPEAILLDDDAQLTLTMLYELHLAGLDGVDDSWGWDAHLLELRRRLEAPFEVALRRQAAASTSAVRSTSADDVVAALWDMTAPTTEPGLAGFMAADADIGQYRELLIHKSLNQLREADLHTCGIPRLQGPPKAALIEIQADEYGDGRFERMHSRLFARTLEALGLSARFAHYVDAAPAITLASLNALSYFGIHRRLLGALIGHLCAVEATSALPSRKLAGGLRRLGFGDEATAFFDVHVEADSVHEQIALRDLAGGLVQQRPDYGEDVLFGAATCLAFDDRLATHLTRAWSRGVSSLRA